MLSIFLFPRYFHQTALCLLIFPTIHTFLLRLYSWNLYHYYFQQALILPHSFDKSSGVKVYILFSICGEVKVIISEDVITPFKYKFSQNILHHYEIFWLCYFKPLVLTWVSVCVKEQTILCISVRSLHWRTTSKERENTATANASGPLEKGFQGNASQALSMYSPGKRWTPNVPR